MTQKISIADNSCLQVWRNYSADTYRLWQALRVKWNFIFQVFHQGYLPVLWLQICSDGTNATFRAMFKEPLEIQPNTNYTAVSVFFIILVTLLALGLNWWKYFKGKTFNLNPFQVSTLKGLDSHYGTKGLRKVTNFPKIVWNIHYFENWINISRWQLTATMGERWLSSSATQLATTMAPRWKMGRFQRLFFTPKIPIVKRFWRSSYIWEKSEQLSAFGSWSRGTAVCNSLGLAAWLARPKWCSRVVKMTYLKRFSNCSASSWKCFSVWEPVLCSVNLWVRFRFAPHQLYMI